MFLPVAIAAAIVARLARFMRRVPVAMMLALTGNLLAASGSVAAPLEMQRLAAHRGADGVYVELETRFDLPQGVEEALQKGVALYFTAEAVLRRPRWYWRDTEVSTAVRTWRLSYLPLTQTYRVSFGGLSQTYAALRDALHAVQYCTQWRIAESIPSDDDARYYAEVSYRLDTSQLPRPLQIGLGSQAEWNLAAERTVIVGNGSAR